MVSIEYLSVQIESQPQSYRPFFSLSPLPLCQFLDGDTLVTAYCHLLEIGLS